MARKKISEFAAKTILHEALEMLYSGVSFDTSSDSFDKLNSLDSSKLYVVKVDQGVKKRGKQGLVKVQLTIDKLQLTIEELAKKGYQQFIIEEFVPHESSDERYLAIQRVRNGLEIYFSEKGGIDIEENAESIKRVTLRSDFTRISPKKDPGQATFMQTERSQARMTIPSLDEAIIDKLLQAFEQNYFSFLELNPYLILDTKYKIQILDAAVEVDSAAEFFVDGKWTSDDSRDFSAKEKTAEERAIAELSEKSQASFSLTMLNPNGSIFMLLSGGGASIVLADEAYNQGFGREVANYGEYSGNPNAEETYIYTKNLLSLMIRSNAPKKVLIIGGGVANFTDVRITFRGVIQALSEFAEKLRKQGVKVFVRRGGPRQAEGLLMMREFLEKEQLFGAVHGPELVLTGVMTEALKQIE